ncbi:copper resistance CopC/CopD family protein [Streptomyces cylindrosporus]|uniref:Copper resistance protein CopC n=1 Tax=Streptomyces cylindrosporus TaxID=2927583 RepID=A0ABS9YBP3_9ACTN|nr:copper resistance protein CopC [Streptomyces cylindrosporus]MCI3274648.1 copper resistance protein CopC [Streptomyces cylindrosporus]
MTPTITPRRMRILVLLFLAVVGALLAGAGPASAHAALTGSDPASGVVVDKAPTQVSLTFSEKVATSGDSVRVLDPKGKRVDTGKATDVSGTTYAVPLHSGLPDGTYTVAWQVVSADSHPVAGAFTFSIGAPSQTTVSVSGDTAGGGVVGWLYGFGRYVSYAGFIVLVGGAAFVLACWQRGSGVRPLQRLVVSGWLALTSATLLLLLLRGSYTSSGKVGDIFDLSLLGQVLQTKTGAALVSRLLLLAAAALFIAVLFGAYDKREDEEKRDLTFGLAIGGFVVSAGLAASWAMAEHASTGLQPGIAMPVDVVHLLAVAAWLGGLCALLVALYRAETPIETAAVRRFSAVAFGSVCALIATGVYQSWRQLGSWSAFTDTAYGQLLLVKIGLVTLLVGIAWISRRWTGRLADGVVGAPRGAAGEGAETGEGVGEGVTGRVEEGVRGGVEEGAEEGVDESVEEGVGAGEKQHAGARAGAGASTASGGSSRASADSASTSADSASTSGDSASASAGSATTGGATTGGATTGGAKTVSSATTGGRKTVTSTITGGVNAVSSTTATGSETASATAGSGTTATANSTTTHSSTATTTDSTATHSSTATTANSTPADSSTAADSSTTSGSTAGGDAKRSGESEAAEASEVTGASRTPGASKPPADRKRAAQLARQRAAVDTARQKRQRDADPDRFGLRRSVLAEAAVAVVLLAVTTVLTQTEPGRTEEDANAAKAAASSSSSASDSSSGAVTLTMPFDTGGTDGKGVVSVDLDPARVGGNEMHVYVTRPNGRAFDIPEVKVAFTLEAKKIGPLPVAPDHVATGHWAASGIQIPMAGDWKVAVTVRTSDIDQVTVSKNAQIG